MLVFVGGYGVIQVSILDVRDDVSYIGEDVLWCGYFVEKVMGIIFVDVVYLVLIDFWV